MKDIDTILKNLLNEESDANWDICDYIRSGISVEEKRYALQEVERMIKKIAGNPENKFFFDLFSEKEAEDLHSLLLTRGMILDEMMQHTPEEMERFRYQNDRLLRLTKEAIKQEKNMIQMFFHTPYREEDLMLYDLDKSLVFTWGDEDAVIKMSNDDYYGSDFGYMLHLIVELTERIPCDANLINGCCILFHGEKEAMAENANTLDDGTTWADGLYLHHEAFHDICICYAVHAVCTHLPYSIPDLLRMDNFYVSVKLEYGHEYYEHKEENRTEEEEGGKEE